MSNQRALLDYCRSKFVAAGITFNPIVARQEWPHGHYQIGLRKENTASFIVNDTLELPDLQYNPFAVVLHIGEGKFGTLDITFYYRYHNLVY